MRKVNSDGILARLASFVCLAVLAFGVIVAS